jgi:hypothetical protein
VEGELVTALSLSSMTSEEGSFDEEEEGSEDPLIIVGGLARK